MTEYYSVDIFFNSYSVDGHLGYFHALDIVNCAAMNKVVHMSFWIMAFSEYMISSVILGHMVVLFLMFRELPYISP